MKGKTIVVIAAVILINLRTLDIFLNVITGNIGNYENWRIIFSFLGFLIILMVTVLFYNSAKKQGKI